MSDLIRMNAYYYGFDETGVRDIDLILSAVASAGKAYHHTEHWVDEPEGGGPSEAEKIQRAASNAAESLLALLAERDEARRAAGRYARLYSAAVTKYDAIHALFAGGPDTPCRTTWPDGVECVEVPMADLRRALDIHVDGPNASAGEQS